MEVVKRLFGRYVFATYTMIKSVSIWGDIKYTRNIPYTILIPFQYHFNTILIPFKYIEDTSQMGA